MRRVVREQNTEGAIVQTSHCSAQVAYLRERRFACILHTYNGNGVVAAADETMFVEAAHPSPCRYSLRSVR